MNPAPPPGYTLLTNPDDRVEPGDIFIHLQPGREWEKVVFHVGNVRFWNGGKNPCLVARKNEIPARQS